MTKKKIPNITKELLREFFPLHFHIDDLIYEIAHQCAKNCDVDTKVYSYRHYSAPSNLDDSKEICEVVFVNDTISVDDKCLYFPVKILWSEDWKKDLQEWHEKCKKADEDYWKTTKWGSKENFYKHH